MLAILYLVLELGGPWNIPQVKVYIAISSIDIDVGIATVEPGPIEVGIEPVTPDGDVGAPNVGIHSVNINGDNNLINGGINLINLNGYLNIKIINVEINVLNGRINGGINGDINGDINSIGEHLTQQRC
jgi:hypothetical protein